MPAGTPYPVTLSVIIPSFQEGSRIGKILGQIPVPLRRGLGIEVIVSDGGSTDGTLPLAREGADGVAENPDGHRQTIGEGRNRGADLARGAVLLFLDADVTLPDAGRLFRRVIAAFADGRLAAATCRVMVEPAEATRFDRWFHTCFNAWCRLLTSLGFGMARGEFQAVSAELFRRIGGYNETLAAAEDYDLFRRIARHGRIMFLADVTVYESPRRYRALGYPRVLALWFMNAISVAFRGRAKSREWTAVR